MGSFVGSLGAKLTSGTGPGVVLNGACVFFKLPLPYDDFAAGATNGCASVLKTTTARRVNSQNKPELEALEHLHLSSEMRFGSSNVR